MTIVQHGLDSLLSVWPYDAWPYRDDAIAVSKPSTLLRYDTITIRQHRHDASALRLGDIRRVPVSNLVDSAGEPIGDPPALAQGATSVSDITRIIDDLFDWISLAIEAVITPDLIAPLLSANGHAVRSMVDRELSRVLSIRIADMPGIDDMIDEWIKAHVRLIKGAITGELEDPDVTRSLIGDIKRHVTDAARRGDRVETLRNVLLERYNVSQSRADLIARDQTLKLNGQITKKRQTDAGIREYRWNTSRDDRVRPTHRDLHNTTQSWNNPPRVAPGRYEHPGGDYQCRCIAVPIVPSWMQ